MSLSLYQTGGYTEASIGKCKTQTNTSNDYDDKKYEREAEEETGERHSERTTRKRRFTRRFNTLGTQYRVRYYTCILSRDSQARRRRSRVHVVKEELPKRYDDDRRTFVLLYAYALVLLHLQDIRVARANLLFTISHAAARGAPNTDPELFCRQGRLTHYLFEPPTPPSLLDAHVLYTRLLYRFRPCIRLDPRSRACYCSVVSRGTDFSHLADPLSFMAGAATSADLTVNAFGGKMSAIRPISVYQQT
uniref:Uncharacterized protein n=1 Tax=Trichogramma kaykai TaxID=54128 RepID=A0ABD2W6M1_9HYME